MMSNKRVLTITISIETTVVSVFSLSTLRKSDHQCYFFLIEIRSSARLSMTWLSAEKRTIERIVGYSTMMNHFFANTTTL